MRKTRFLSFLRYGLALFLVGLALMISLAASTTFGPYPFLLFFAAVIFSTWYGGLGAGLLASVLSILVVNQFFLYPAHRTDVEQLDLARFFSFILMVSILTLIQRRNQRMVTELKRSRDQLDIYLRDMANGITVQDRDGKLLYANYEAARMMDYISGEALIQASRDELLEPFDLFDEAGEPFPASSLPGRLALLGMRYPETVLRWRSKASGKERWAYDKARPIFDAKGEVQASISLFLDITELKETQAALAEQRKQFQVTLRSIGDGVIATDASGIVTFINPVAAALTGWTEREASGQPISALLRLIDEESRQGIEKPWEPILQQGAATLLVHPLLLVSKDGIERPIGMRMSPLREEENAPKGAVLVFWDMTQFREAEQALRVKARQQEVIATLGLRALTGIDLATLMQEACQQLTQTLEVEYAKVLELLPGGERLLLRAGIGWAAGLVGQATVDTGSDSQAGFTLLSKEPVIVEDLHTETRFKGPPLLRNHQVVSGMSVIIAGNKQPWGVLGTHTTKQRSFTRDDIHFLQAIANLLAATIQREQVERAERDQRIFAEALRETAVALCGTLDLAQVLDRILASVGQVVPHDAADIMLIDGEAARVVRYRGYRESQAAEILPDLRLSVADTATLREMVATGQPLLIGDTRNYAGWLNLPRMEWLRSYVAAPLVVHGQVKGFLNLCSLQPHFFTPEQANRLQSFAAQAILAIRNAQLYGEALQSEDAQTMHEVAQELRRELP